MWRDHTPCSEAGSDRLGQAAYSVSPGAGMEERFLDSWELEEDPLLTP